MASRPPPLDPDVIPWGRIWSDQHVAKDLKERTPFGGEKDFALGVARVVRIDYTNHTASLQVLTGETEYVLRSPIPITYPGAGARQFFGAMPEIGSYCIIGYFPTRPQRLPAILSWVLSNPNLGQDWVPLQQNSVTEFDLNPRKQAELEGAQHRSRYKLRHMVPGNIVCSSAQGADLVLDEGVILMNRRADEIRIRDQDSAIVFRSQQQFHATGGTRSYIGMVQRDATFLPTQVISDGLSWDGLKQTLDGETPIPPGDREVDRSRPEGILNPNRLFFQSTPGQGAPDSDFILDPQSLDPYIFLSRGLFIGEDGVVLNPSQTIPSAEYNGKPMFRVSVDPNPDNPENLPTNSVLDENDTNTLVEHRIEVNHTWDGRLPVTEQTEGFDADRIWDSNPFDENNPLASGEGPFIEFVLGSVVGNDAFSAQGRELYGVPLVPRVLDQDGVVNARLDSGVGVSINEHAATLFKLDPPVAPFASSFTSWTKDGRFKAFVSGPETADSIEIATSGGIVVKSGGAIDLRTGSPLKIQAPSGDDEDNFGFCFTSPTGAICLTAGAPTTRGSFVARSSPSGISENQLPGLLLEAPTSSAHLTSGRTVLISAGDQIQLANSNTVVATPRQQFAISTDQLSQNVNVIDRTVLGKETTLYSGPRNFLPTNAPLRSVTFAGTPLTGHIGGKTDEYKMVFGDRDETFTLGNHTTQMVVGNQTYRTGVGTVTLQAGANTLRLDTATGLNALVAAGTFNVTSSTSVSIRGVASVKISSAGPTTVSGTVITLGGTGAVGGIVNGSDIDPLSGLPLAALGLGSPGHLLGPPLP